MAKRVIKEYFEGPVSFKELGNGSFELNGPHLYNKESLRNLQIVVNEMMLDFEDVQQVQADQAHKARMNSRFNPSPPGTEMDI